MSKKKGQFAGEKYAFVRFGSVAKIIGDDAEVVMSCGNRASYHIWLHVEGVKLQWARVGSWEEVVCIAEDFANQYPGRFASSLLSAAWRKDNTYDLQKLMFGHRGIKTYPRRSGDSANALGKIL